MRGQDGGDLRLAALRVSLDNVPISPQATNASALGLAPRSSAKAANAPPTTSLRCAAQRHAARVNQPFDNPEQAGQNRIHV